MKVYRVGDEYLHITKECPPAFKGVLFVCYRGVSPSTVIETVIPSSGIPDASAEVHPSALSPDWVEALRLPNPHALMWRKSHVQEAASCRTSDQRANHTSEEPPEPGIDRLFRQMAENPVTSLLLFPFTVMVIILWTVVAFGQWLYDQAAAYSGTRGDTAQ